jgi:thiol-disulfide isomerase/thioredoxin
MQSLFTLFFFLRRRQSRLMTFCIAAGLSFALALASPFPMTEAKPNIGKLPKDSLANYQFQTLDGRQFSLAGLRGKVVVLDFFAVWCGHSRHHIPTMTKFGASEQERGLQVIGLAVNDAESTRDRVRKFIEEMKINYPVAMISDSNFSDFVQSKDVSVPQTLIYGRDGRLVAYYGGHDDKTAADVAATVDRELGK